MTAEIVGHRIDQLANRGAAGSKAHSVVETGAVSNSVGADSYRESTTAHQKFDAALWAAGQTFGALWAGIKQGVPEFFTGLPAYVRDVGCPFESFMCVAGAGVVYVFGRPAAHAVDAIGAGIMGAVRSASIESALADVAVAAGGIGGLAAMFIPFAGGASAVAQPPLSITASSNLAVASVGVSTSGVTTGAAGAVAGAVASNTMQSSARRVVQGKRRGVRIDNVEREIKEINRAMRRLRRNGAGLLDFDYLWLKLRRWYLNEHLKAGKANSLTDAEIRVLGENMEVGRDAFRGDADSMFRYATNRRMAMEAEKNPPRPIIDFDNDMPSADFRRYPRLDEIERGRRD